MLRPGLFFCLFALVARPCLGQQPYIHANTNSVSEHAIAWKTTSSDITFTVQARSTGYWAIGLSSDPYMEYTDTYWGYVHDGQPVVYDAWIGRSKITPSNDVVYDAWIGRSKAAPTNDVDQNHNRILSASVVDGVITVKFSRPLVTGRSDDEAIARTTYVFYAYHDLYNPGDGSNPAARMREHKRYYKYPNINLMTSSTPINGAPPSGPPASTSTQGPSSTQTNTAAVTTTQPTVTSATVTSAGGGETAVASTTTGGPTPDSTEPPLGTLGSTVVSQYSVKRDDFELHWDLLGNETISITFKCKTKGWCSILISEEAARMNSAGADIYRGAIDQAGTLVMQDCWSNGYSVPPQDTEDGANNDMQSTRAGVDGEWSWYTFTRKLDTGDKRDQAITDIDLHLGYAYHQDETDLTAKHTYYFPEEQEGAGLKVNFITGDVTVKGERFMPLASSVLSGLVGVIALCYLLLVYAQKCYRAASASSHMGCQRKQPHVRGTELASHQEVDEKGDPVGRSSLPPLKSKGRGVSTLGQGRFMTTSVSRLDVEIFAVYLVIVGACVVALPKDNLAIRLGQLAVPNAFFALLLNVKNGPIAFLFNASFTRTIHIHRWLGVLTFVLGFIHGLVQMLKFGLEELFEESQYIWGFLTWVVLIVIFLTSLGPVRRRFYQAFYTAHFSFILFFIFGTLHATEIWLPYIGLGIVLLVISEMVGCLYGHKDREISLLQVKGYDDDKCVQIRFAKSPWERSCSATSQIGQYVWLNFPDVSRTEWHPFSVSNGPNEPVREVHIKDCGNFTSQLLQMARVRSSAPGRLRLRCRGPYGIVRANHHRYDSLLLVAGGIGITPIMGVLKDIYGNVEDNTRPMHASNLQSVTLVWAVKSLAALSWFEPELRHFQKITSEDPSLPSISLRLFITQAEGASRTETLNELALQMASRPQLAAIFIDVASNAKDRPVFVFACGPEGLVHKAWDCCQDTTESEFHFHKETFEL
eukprot:g20428.t1